MPVKLLTSGGGGVNLVPSSSIASDVTVAVPSKSGTTVLTDVADNIGIAATGANYITMSTNGSERVRLDSSGNLLVGTTSNASIAHRMVIKTASDYQLALDATGTYSVLDFCNSGTVKSQLYYNNDNHNFYIVNQGGGVYIAAGATAWTANSDERLKDIIEPITNAAEKVSSIRAVIGKYKTDEEGTRRSFLIAQDVQAVLPEAVNVQNDEQGTLGLQYSDVIPLLVAAINELTQRIEALEYTKQGE